jgi:hypothetical protein
VKKLTSGLNPYIAAILLAAVLTGIGWTATKTGAKQRALNRPPKGFVALFNGRDLAGWKGLVGNPKTRREMSSEELAKAQAKADEDVRAHWKVVDGVLCFDGTEGWVFVTRDKIDAEPKSLLTSKIGPDEIHLYNSNDHKQNFLDCIKSRKDPIASAEIGHRTSTVCHLGNIAMLLDRKLKWDPKAERFINDSAANRMLAHGMRAPWRL